MSSSLGQARMETAMEVNIEIDKILLQIHGNQVKDQT